MDRKRPFANQPTAKRASVLTGRPGRPSALLDTRIVYCGGCVDQLRKLPDCCVDLIYIDPPTAGVKHLQEARECKAQ